VNGSSRELCFRQSGCCAPAEMTPLLGRRKFDSRLFGSGPPCRWSISRWECNLSTVINTLDLPPRLLVGTRTIADLEAAIRGGADIVEFEIRSRDFEPSSLHELVDLAALRAPRTGISVALGEAQDWLESSSRPVLPHGVRWARLGLAGCQDRPEWRNDWQQLRSEIDVASGGPLKWLAVAYADAASARAPKVGEVLDAAVDSQCAGLWLESHAQTGGSIADSLSPCELTQLIWMARELHLPVFIGGGMGQGDLDWICALEPAVIAVRSTVCELGDADQPVSETRVNGFKQSLEAAAGFDRPRWDFHQQCHALRAAAEATTVAGSSR